MVPFPVSSSDPEPRFQGHRVTYALDVLCAQLTRDLLAIAKFLSAVYDKCTKFGDRALRTLVRSISMVHNDIQHACHMCHHLLTFTDRVIDFCNAVYVHINIRTADFRVIKRPTVTDVSRKRSRVLS